MHDHDTLAPGSGLFGDDAHRAAPDRFVDKFLAVETLSAYREEQIARRQRPRVDRAGADDGIRTARQELAAHGCGQLAGRER